MISQILIISPGGILCYSKVFFSKFDQSDDLVSSLLTAINQFGKEIKAGDVKLLNFGNFNFVFDYDKESDYLFVLIIDINDFEEEARDKLQLIKNEFFRRYNSILENYVGDKSVFKDFDNFILEKVFLPPQIIITGQKGVGKTAIFELLPGEKILKIDDNLNEHLIKNVPVNFGNFKECSVREIDLNELVKHIRNYIDILNSAEIIFVVTNSAARNMGTTLELLSELIQKKYKADYFIIANFQDYKDIAYEPQKIAEFFNMRVFGFSAIQEDAQETIYNYFLGVVKSSILEKDKIIDLE